MKQRKTLRDTIEKENIRNTTEKPTDKEEIK